MVPFHDADGGPETFDEHGVVGADEPIFQCPGMRLFNEMPSEPLRGLDGPEQMPRKGILVEPLCPLPFDRILDAHADNGRTVGDGLGDDLVNDPAADERPHSIMDEDHRGIAGDHR